MTSLIGAGQGARRRAQQGFGAVSKLESQEIRQMDMLDAARQQQEMSNLGTGAGFGAMYGMSQLAPAAAGQTASGVATASQLSSAAAAEAAALKAGADAAAVAGTTTAAGTSGAAAGAGTTAAAGGSAATAGTLATLATPIAIGLGAAFLINKLFD